MWYEIWFLGFKPKSNHLLKIVLQTLSKIVTENDVKWKTEFNKAFNLCERINFCVKFQTIKTMCWNYDKHSDMKDYF